MLCSAAIQVLFIQMFLVSSFDRFSDLIINIKSERCVDVNLIFLEFNLAMITMMRVTKSMSNAAKVPLRYWPAYATREILQ